MKAISKINKKNSASIKHTKIATIKRIINIIFNKSNHQS